MPTRSAPVGAAVAEALARARHHRERSPRKVRVRLLTAWGDLEGLIVQARIVGRSEAEILAQDGLGVRHVPSAELDFRAAELAGLVDEAAAEVEAAVSQAPASARPSQSETEFDADAYERIAEAAYEQVLGVMRPLVDGAPASLSRGAALEAVFLGLMKVAALASLSAGMAKDDAREMLEEAVEEQLGRISEGYGAGLKPKLDA